MNAWWSLLAVWVLAVVMMALGWVWQWRRRNAGIVDVLWASGLGGAAVLIACLGDGAFAPRLLLALAGELWATRLAWHLWQRVRKDPEDGRYQALRERWQGDQRRFFALFQLQAALIVLFALPFVAVASNPRSIPVALAAGVVVWIVSVVGEAIADAQLARFRAEPGHAGQTCRCGLWRYSRHPNYFFEWLHWFAYVLFAIGSPWWWLAWTGPVVMYLFLRYVSGIPFTEQQALRSRGDDYRAYQRATPMLFPWFVKDPRHTTRRAP